MNAITDEMIEAARINGTQAGILMPGVKREDVQAFLRAALVAAPAVAQTVPYPLWVNITTDTRQARFVGATERRAYFRVQTKDGKEWTVHANDIQPTSARRVR